MLRPAGANFLQFESPTCQSFSSEPGSPQPGQFRALGDQLCLHGCRLLNSGPDLASCQWVAFLVVNLFWSAYAPFYSGLTFQTA